MRVAPLVAAVLALLVVLPAQAVAAPAGGPRIDLQVLVVTDGTREPEAFLDWLDRTGVPVQVLDLQDPARPRVDRGFLADEVGGRPRARFQGVVLPGPAPDELDPAELTALHEYERRFAIRQISAHAVPGVTSGLPEPAFRGAMDGKGGALTREALGAEFSANRGPVPFGDPSPHFDDSWVEGFRAPAGFRSWVTVEGGLAVAGVRTGGGREEALLTMGYGIDLPQFQVLAPGLTRWLTRGVHLGLERAWLAVHIDDVLLPNARWVPGVHCTAGSDCPASVGPRPVIRMTAADVAYAVEWQRRNGFRMDLAYNGGGSASAGPADPLTAALVAAKDEFGWINHTYTHSYLGCVRDFSVTPWECATVPLFGWTRYVGEGTIADEISRNIDFARTHGLPIEPAELVTGEHGGLRKPPRMPEDNPNLAGALADTGILTLASDASAEPDQRMLGVANTVPRHPINLDFNTATLAETVDQYNYISTARADGGDGSCEPDGSCIAPANPVTGFRDVVIPAETALTLRHALANDPRPHYVHQPQLTEDRTLYPILERVLAGYRALFTEARPLITPPMTATRDVLNGRAAFARAVDEGRVGGYVIDGVVTVESDGHVDVPLTVPPGTRLDGAEFGDPYGGVRSGWFPAEGARTLTTREQR
ncbi:hypothetical protein GCM10009836_55590 [Pseudonocardia ailaonensis]|uniref:NodB homology domain-containing protein n=1 Tax=Pseudonocardia ailaonensis TaxID=367279 RepID=A0ABN2NGB0_9PSEU